MIILQNSVGKSSRNGLTKVKMLPGVDCCRLWMIFNLEGLQIISEEHSMDYSNEGDITFNRCHPKVFLYLVFCIRMAVNCGT